MNANKFITGFFLMGIILINHSCSKNSNNESVMKQEVELISFEEETSLEGINPNTMDISNNEKKQKSITTDFTPNNLKIIKSADTKYKVKDISKASKEIKNLVLANNGYVSEMRFTNSSYSKQNVFVIKVPNYQFDGLLEKISSSAIKIDYENITTQDVTEAYIDAESRLKTKLKVKKRYEEILRTKAYKVTDLLEVEEKINDIQEEIEAVQGKLNFMKNKVYLSTINIELYEESKTLVHNEENDNKFSKEINKAMNFGLEIIKVFLLAMVYIWPILLLLILIYIAYRRKRK
ncbi:DUF4349 domain-containing protein [Pseudofulvibacter geojedonensis]|uniref:DUF4349 domain-containing protein n=2 Tax=Pseudofulvibacter geojedonensis TaxID=1123758 RepID=A0ABW3I4C2_9FLAO